MIETEKEYFHTCGLHVDMEIVIGQNLWNFSHALLFTVIAMVKLKHKISKQLCHAFCFSKTVSHKMRFIIVNVKLDCCKHLPL